jgi:hypothetical protein
VPGLNNPADLDFDAVNDVLCIPNSGANTVTFFDIDCSTGISAEGPWTVLRAIPNPVGDVLQLEPPLTKAEPYILLDARGLLIGGGTLAARAMLDVSALRPGIYSIQFTRTRSVVRFVRQ